MCWVPWAVWQRPSPFVSSFQPSEKAKAAGAAVSGYLNLKDGENSPSVAWQAVWIIKRTRAAPGLCSGLDGELADPDLGASSRKSSRRPMHAMKRFPSKPEILVVVGHLHASGLLPPTKFVAGPQPSPPAGNWKGGFPARTMAPPDMAGRVFKNKPAPDNLQSAATYVSVRHQAADW